MRECSREVKRGAEGVRENSREGKRRTQGLKRAWQGGEPRLRACSLLRDDLAACLVWILLKHQSDQHKAEEEEEWSRVDPVHLRHSKYGGA